MPVVSSPLDIFAKPLLYTQLGMVSVDAIANICVKMCGQQEAMNKAALTRCGCKLLGDRQEHTCGNSCSIASGSEE